MIGKRFSKLVVLAKLKRRHVDKSLRYRCICDCGKETKTVGLYLRNGSKKSCGCLHLRQKGLSKTVEYDTWGAMKARCYRVTHACYRDYGFRGITVCKRWMKFENFLKDMGPKPKGLTLERKDNDKGYCKSNCRWATRKEQANNRRSCRKFRVLDQTKRRIDQFPKLTGDKYATTKSSLRASIVSLAG